MKRFVLTMALTLSVSLTMSMQGCVFPETARQSQIPQQPEVIQAIRIFRLTNDHTSAPSNDWATVVSSPAPHPSEVQQIFSQNDRMFLGIKINPQFTSTVRFSKFTYFNRESGLESQISYTPGDTGPFEPGQTVLLSFTNPFTVPSQTGTYEVRIYLENKVVASAMFQVKTAVVASIFVFKAPVVPTMPGITPQDGPSPHPIGVQRQLSTNDSIFLVVGINYRYDQNVTFSRYTFFDTKSGTEKEIPFPVDLTRPLSPGQLVPIGYTNPWHVPNAAGVYEIRLYHNNEVAGSAVFEVKLGP